MTQSYTRVGLGGFGAIGRAIGEHLLSAQSGPFQFIGAVSLTRPPDGYIIRDFSELARISDIGIEALPPDSASECAKAFLRFDKDIIMATTGNVAWDTELLDILRHSKGRIIVPYGAISTVPNIKTLAQSCKERDIKNVKIVSTKPPSGFKGDYDETKGGLQTMFTGHASGAVKKYGKNANVSVSLALGCGLSPKDVRVEIYADPDQKLNKHRILVEFDDGSLFDEYCENVPDPANPKTSLGTADSLISALKDPENEAFTILTAKNISFLDAAPA